MDSGGVGDGMDDKEGKDMTAFSAAFNRAGFSKHYMTAYVQAAQFIKAGGTRAEWIKAFDSAAEKLPREGQARHASDGQRSCADPRSPTPSEGHDVRASDGHLRHADAGSPRRSEAAEMPGEGQSCVVSDGQQPDADPRQPLGGFAATDRSGHSADAKRGHDRSAASVREPSMAERAATAKVMRLTILDTFKLYDGQSVRSIGDFRRGELATVRAMNLQHAAIIDQILGHARADSDQKVRTIVKEQDLQRFIQEAARRTGGSDVA